MAFKPTSTIGQKQKTVSRDGVDVDLIARGRHDPCVVPRAVPMVEAMVAIVLADQLLRVRALASAKTPGPLRGPPVVWYATSANMRCRLLAGADMRSMNLLPQRNNLNTFVPGTPMQTIKAVYVHEVPRSKLRQS